MSWYLRNATATRFGATRKCLDNADATASAAISGYASLTVILYTCTSNGTLTERARGTYSLTGDLGKAARTITLGNIASDITVPEGGGVAVRVTFPDNPTWYSTVTDGHVIKAGAHQVTLTFDATFDGDLEEYYVNLYYGAQQSYAPDGIFYKEASTPVIVTHPSDASGRTFNQSTQFTADATGETSVGWQVSKDGGSTWATISGATTDTLTINAAGNNYQYRAAYTNDGGTTYTNAATLTMSYTTTDIGAGTYTAEMLGDFLSTCGSNAITVTGAVVGTGTCILDNPALVLSGSTGKATDSFTVNILTCKAFKTLSGLTVGNPDSIRDNNAATDGIFFPTTDSDFASVVGGASISDCVIDGSLFFGDTWTTGGYYRVDVSNLTITGCTHDHFIRGMADGLTITTVTGDNTTTPATGSTYPWHFGGDDVTITDTDLTSSRNSVLKVNSTRGSSTGWSVKGCTFTGGHEEQTGSEGGNTLAFGHVTAKTADTVTWALDTNNSVFTDSELTTGTTLHPKGHLIVHTGDAAGHYHLITAQDGTTLTIDTTRFATTDIAVNDKVGIAWGMADSVWGSATTPSERNSHVLKGGYIDHGNGCNIGFSMYGNCWGNTVSDDFTFPQPATLTSEKSAQGDGPAIVAADWAIGVDEFSAPSWGVNAHNTYNGCTFENIDVPISVGTYYYKAIGDPTASPEAVTAIPVGYPARGRNVTVTNNTWAEGARVQVIDALGITWTGNTSAAPSIKYTGLMSSCDYAQTPAVRWPYTWRADYNDWDGDPNPDFRTRENWLWEYDFTLNADSGTTWAAPLDPSDVTATIDADHVDVAFTNNGGGDDGIKWKRCVDGAWSEVTTVATPSLTAFVDASPPSPSTYTTLLYAVATYNESGTSAYIESNTLIGTAAGTDWTLIRSGSVTIWQ